MSENGPTSHHDQAPASNRGTQLVPLFLLCVLAAAVVINFSRGRNDQTLTGVVVMDLPVYKFYPDQNACGPAGTPYLLVPNSRFGEVAQNSAPASNFGALFHATWRVKLRGTSRISVAMVLKEIIGGNSMFNTSSTRSAWTAAMSALKLTPNSQLISQNSDG
jgi:hypothetical protein